MSQNHLGDGLMDSVLMDPEHPTGIPEKLIRYPTLLKMPPVKDPRAAVVDEILTKNGL